VCLSVSESQITDRHPKTQWSLYVPLVITFGIPTVCPQIISMGYVSSLHIFSSSTDRYVLVIKTKCVFGKVGVEFLYVLAATVTVVCYCGDCNSCMLLRLL
jgi:hypothetical protein